jgi:hypothetical protein
MIIKRLCEGTASKAITTVKTQVQYHSLSYNGSPSYPLQKYVADHVQCHATLGSLGEAVAEQEKVRVFIKGVKCEKVKSAIPPAIMSGQDNLSFDMLTRNLMMNQAMCSEIEQAPGRKVHDVARKVHWKKGEKKGKYGRPTHRGGKGKGRRITYSPEEWNTFTPEKKAEIIAARKGAKAARSAAVVMTTPSTVPATGSRQTSSVVSDRSSLTEVSQVKAAPNASSRNKGASPAQPAPKASWRDRKGGAPISEVQVRDAPKGIEPMDVDALIPAMAFPRMSVAQFPQNALSVLASSSEDEDDNGEPEIDMLRPPVGAPTYKESNARRDKGIKQAS